MEIETIIKIVLITFAILGLLAVGFAFGANLGCKCLVMISTKIEPIYLDPIFLP